MKETCMKKKLKVSLLVLSLITGTFAQADALPEISFEKAKWKLSKHVKLEKGILTFEGAIKKFSGAHCIVPVTGLKVKKHSTSRLTLN